MNELFLLVLLSQNAAGDINASFVNTAALGECEQKQLVVAGILSSAGIAILQSRCIRSRLRFSEFGHADSTSTPRRFYRIAFGPQQVEIDSMPDWHACIEQQRTAASPTVYCASSIQQSVVE